MLTKEAQDQAYNLGVELALEDSGLTKVALDARTSYKLQQLLTSPVRGAQAAGRGLAAAGKAVKEDVGKGTGSQTLQALGLGGAGAGVGALAGGEEGALIGGLAGLGLGGGLAGARALGRRAGQRGLKDYEAMAAPGRSGAISSDRLAEAEALLNRARMMGQLQSAGAIGGGAAGGAGLGALLGGGEE